MPATYSSQLAMPAIGCLCGHALSFQFSVESLDGRQIYSNGNSPHVEHELFETIMFHLSKIILVKPTVSHLSDTVLLVLINNHYPFIYHTGTCSYLFIPLPLFLLGYPQDNCF